jgi:hypothetical protein
MDRTVPRRADHADSSTSSSLFRGRKRQNTLLAHASSSIAGKSGFCKPGLCKPGLCTLALLAAIACGQTPDGDGDDAATGAAGTASGGQTAVGQSGGAATAAQGTTGGSPETGGATGNATGGVAAAVGGSATGGGSGGVAAGGTSTGGAATGGMAGGGTGGVGAGGTNTGGVVAGGGTGAGGVGTGGVGGIGGVGTGGVGTGGVGTGGVGTGGVGAGGVGTGGVGITDTVTRTASTFTFHHYPIETDGAGVWNGPTSPGTQATSTVYDTVVLENGYLRVTLLPEYGGRILSIIHKPTNRELLYQNPIGTPYLMLEGIFYYDYLVVLGGIFPSFPEPEHGKYWNQPYDFEVVSETQEAITVRMSRQDDLGVASGVPAKYDVGRTDVLVELDVTLRAGSTCVELGTKLTNTRSTSIPRFEYWTNTTLAPGSTPGDTAIPLNSRILADMEEVHLVESDWSWFGSAEERVNGEIFKWNNLSYFENWQDEGIAYASPDYRANWSGMVNYDNTMGVVRVSDNVETIGLKLWSFGRDSVNVDMNDSTQWFRPLIEMWHGVTTEFWIRGTMSANEVRQWTDSYFPTMGLEEVTAASEYGAMYLSSSEAGTDTVLSATATLTVPDQTVRAVLRLDGTTIAEQDVVVAAADATTVSASVESGSIPSGAVLDAEFLQGSTSLLSGQVILP